MTNSPTRDLPTVEHFAGPQPEEKQRTVEETPESRPACHSTFTSRLNCAVQRSGRQRRSI